jgi:hypothetical protein
MEKENSLSQIKRLTKAEAFRPGIVSVRIVCPPDVIEAALASLADSYGEAWQPSTRKPSRYEGGEILQYGTLIITVPRN